MMCRIKMNDRKKRFFSLFVLLFFVKDISNSEMKGRISRFFFKLFFDDFLVKIEF